MRPARHYASKYTTGMRAAIETSPSQNQKFEFYAREMELGGAPEL
jgi:hypothetical protein